MFLNSKLGVEKMKKIIKKIALILLALSGCVAYGTASLKEVTSVDNRFRFSLPSSFKQTEKAHPVTTRFKNGNYELAIEAFHKDFFDNSFTRFQAWRINREHLIYFSDIQRIKTNAVNINGYPIAAYYCEGESPSMFGTMYYQGYTYAIEMPNFYVLIRLLHSTMWRQNAMNRIKAEGYMRPLLESLTQID